MSDAPLSARTIVRALYRCLLLREPDPEGLAGYERFLSEGGAVEEAIQTLLRSAEFQTRAPDIVRVYATPLRRITDDDADALDGEPPQVEAFLQRLRLHPTWADEDVLARMDQPLPALDRAVAYRLSSADARAALLERGVQIEGRSDARGNWLLIDETVTATGLKIDLHASRGAVIAMGGGCAVHGEIEIQGDGAIVVLGGHRGHVQTYEVHLHGEDNVFIFGDRSTCAGASFHLEGPGRHMVIGRECMLSGGLYLTGTDNHAILDQATGEVLNMPQNLLIGPKAWIGHGAMILKGAHVGRGAVVAARALLTTPAPDHALVAGTPARVMRTGVDWSRAMPSEMG